MNDLVQKLEDITTGKMLTTIVIDDPAGKLPGYFYNMLFYTLFMLSSDTRWAIACGHN